MLTLPRRAAVQTSARQPPEPRQRVAIEGHDPVYACTLPARRARGGRVTAALGLAASATSPRLRGGRPQSIDVSLAPRPPHSLAELPVPARPAGRRATGEHRTATVGVSTRARRRRSCLHLHGGLPHLREGTLRRPGLRRRPRGGRRGGRRAASAEALEEALAARALCGAHACGATRSGRASSAGPALAGDAARRDPADRRERSPEPLRTGAAPARPACARST